MDEKLRASFIPKQPLVGHDTAAPQPKRSGGGSGGAFLYISLGVLFLALLSWVGMIAWRAFIERSIEEKNQTLVDMSRSFAPADVAKYKRLNDRINIAVERLRSHHVIHPIFDVLSEITLPQVQYTTFSFSVAERPVDPVAPFSVGEVDDTGVVAPPPTMAPQTDYRITMSAVADTFETISLQTTIFKDNEFIKSSNFTNFALDDETGAVTFDIEATIEPSLISYVDMIARSGQVEVEEGGEPISEDEEGSEEDEAAETEETSEAAELPEEDLIEEDNQSE